MNGVNDPTVANPDADVTDEDTAVTIDVLANDSDPDASDNPLMVQSVTQPTDANDGAVVNNGGDVTFTPGSNFNSLGAGQSDTTTFTYTTDTGITETVTVTINGVDDPTVINPDADVTDEDTAVTIDVLVNDSDVDANDNPLMVQSVTQPTDANDGTVVNNGGDVTFTPGSNFNSLSPGESGTTTFTYTTDTGATETVTVTVNGVNDPTVINPDADVTDEDTAVTVDVLANDSDPDASDNPLAVASVTQPTDTDDGVVVNNGGDVTFTPGSNFNSLGPGDSGTTTFTYTTDTGVSETVTVTVTGVNDAPDVQDDIVVSTTDIDPVTIDVVSNDSDVDGNIVASTVDLDTTTAGIQNTLVVANEGTWTTDGAGNVTFTPDALLGGQPTPIDYAVADNDGAIGIGTIDLKYSAADVWFGNDESGSVNTADFDQSKTLISGAADQMTFAAGDIAFNAALFSWSGSSQQTVEVNITDDQTQFVSDSSGYSRNYNNLTDIGAGIVFGTTQIVNHVNAMVLAGDPREEVPQVMVILTDASSSQILDDASLLADAQNAKDAGIILVFVAIQEAQDDPVAVARLEAAASLDASNNPLVVTAASYADIDASEIADLLNAIREAAAAGLLPPIVIDLDGDGVEFDDIENGIQFDVDGDGDLEQVAWADEDDAVLVYDGNDNDQVDGVDEISFAQHSDRIGATDLDGLREGFDSNDDLVLDANDDEFESFKLWQDRDGDGNVGEGELFTLAEAGIESIELTTDGEVYYTAGGDVKVHGEGTVNYTDGSEGTFADAEFQYDELSDSDLQVVTDDGNVIDVNGSDAIPEVVGEDLLESAGEFAPAGESSEFEAGGAPAASTGEEDAAAADAAMS